MAVTFVGTTKYTPPAGAGGSATSRTLTLPAGIQAGDTIFVQVQSASSAAANEATVGGIASLNEIGDQVFSGHRHKLYLKAAAEATDASAVLTIATAAALRVTVIAYVYRGAPTVSPVDQILGGNGPAGVSTTFTTPSLTTTTAGTVELQFVGASGGTVAPTAIAMPVSLTTRANESYDSLAAGGSHATSGYNLTSMPLGSSPGGDAWTSTSGVLFSGFTVSLKILTAATSARPTSTVVSTGWVPTGVATSWGCLADESDTTYVESGDNPTGTQPLSVEYGEVSGGNLTVTTRLYATAASPAITVTVALMQGTTVIASRNTVLSTVATDFSWTTTPAETAAIVPGTPLRTRWTPVAA